MQNRVTICDSDNPSLTKIECLLDSEDGFPTIRTTGKVRLGLLDPIIRMCIATNLFPPSASDKSKCKTDEFMEPAGCEFTAYCEPKGYWKEQGGTKDAPLFRALGR